MGLFLGSTPTPEPFVPFGRAHLAVLAVIVVLNLAIGLRRKWSDHARRRFRVGLAMLLLLNETAWHLWNAIHGYWSIQTMLPLHLCSVMVFLSAAMLLTRSYRLYEFLYFLGIGAASQVVITPGLDAWGFPHFAFFQTFVSHGSIITAAIYMTVVEGVRPWPRSILRVAVGANAYMLAVAAINLAIGSNYLFIARKPEAATLMDFLGPWPWYILGLEVVGLITCLLLYLPFAIRDWRDRPAASPAGPA